jgi:hypothetical protein
VPSPLQDERGHPHGEVDHYGDAVVTDEEFGAQVTAEYC